MQAPPASTPHNSHPRVTVWPGWTDYGFAQRYQEKLVANLLDGKSSEALIFCQHPPLLTLGTSATPSQEVRASNTFQIFASGRGGKTTYHGPGQRIIYPILDLAPRGKDLRRYIDNLQRWIIESIHEFGIITYADNEVGVWATVNGRPHKVAAIGIRVRRWITFHGIAINVAPDMSAYEHIIACGLQDRSVTSLAQLSKNISMTDLDEVLLKRFPRYFG